MFCTVSSAKHFLVIVCLKTLQKFIKGLRDINGFRFKECESNRYPLSVYLAL